MNEIKTFTSVWDAIADTPEQAANLRAMSELMQQIAVILPVLSGLQLSEIVSI